MKNTFNYFFSGKVRFNLEYFNDFFASGMEESSSPILTGSSLKLTKNFSLKVALTSLTSYLLGLILYWTGYSEASLLCILITFFLSGTPALVQSIQDIANRIINIDILMTLAAFGSILINQAQEGALLLVLFAISEALEDLVSGKAKSTLFSLKKLSPQSSWLIATDGTLIKKSTKTINIGDIIRIKGGEVIPLDGIIVKGTSSLNLALITGEKIPKSCFLGDVIPAGAYNLEGSLDVKVTHKSSDSTIERIIQLVVSAQKSKPRLEQRLQAWSTAYAVTIICISVGMIFLLPFIFRIPFFGDNSSVYRSLAFLIAASPCALILAIPIAYLSAINACAKEGILLKGGLILDKLALCKSIALDKTGTLTTGNLECSEIKIFYPKSIEAYNVDTLLSLILSIEQSANHPVAQSLVDFIKNKNIVPDANPSRIETVPGYGIKARYNNNEIFIGKTEWILSKIQEDYIPQAQEYIKKKKQNGDMCSLAFIEKHLVVFSLKDSIRPEAFDTIRNLKKQNMSLNVVTGDSKQSACAVAKELGISNIFYDLDPKQKLAKIKELSLQSHLIMIGDGINDAPSLTQADVGIAMGSIGSATAIEAADVVFLHDNISSLLFLLKKSRKTQLIVKENVFLALFIITCISIPALIGIIPLWLAVILHEGSTVIVGINALRLLKKY